ncbi:hypothetical protein ACS0TY_026141 [Phlomoides rotata]
MQIKRPQFNFHQDSIRVQNFLTMKGDHHKMMQWKLCLEEFMKGTSSQIKTLEHQMGQLASTMGQQHQKGKFPSTTETNPIEHCKAIQLRSGTSYEGPRKPLEHDEGEKKEDEGKEKKCSSEDEEEESEPVQEEEK